jgi:hypothetical protein
MIPDWLLQLSTMVIGGAGLYAGIRADLAAMHARIEGAQREAEAAREDARHAHGRIDQFMQRV